MNSETIKGRLNQHVKRRLQSQESTESKISQSQNITSVIANQAIIKEEVTDNTSVKSVKKRKITKKSSTNSVDSNPDDDDKCDKRTDKHETGLDILTLILNYKKSEFLRQPQICEIISDISKKKSNSLPTELIQN